MNRATFDEHLPNFNFDRASAEQIYMVKNNLEDLDSLEALSRKSSAAVTVMVLLLSVREYYRSKEPYGYMWAGHLNPKQSKYVTLEGKALKLHVTSAGVISTDLGYFILR